ncbi:MAG: arsenate reductase [Ignavibacteria bacterium RBG_16_34_14]|nr:MAG: arsenate reductase [Ignavibacteria bacterium RBG_16_34_14]
MNKVTVYEKPTCTTCRNVAKALQEQGIDFEKVNYYIDPFSKAELKSLLKKMKMKPAEVMRTKEKIYRDLDIKNKNYSDEELIDLMVKHPDLVQRPIIEMGDKAILARPPEKIKELFK